MAELVLTDPFISINGADVSDHFMSIALPAEAETIETTAFGGSWRTRVGGLKDSSITMDFIQDFDAGQIDSILWPLLGGPAAALVIRGKSDAIGANNPEWRVSAILKSYPPLGTSVGELVTGSAAWDAAGPLTRHVA